MASNVLRGMRDVHPAPQSMFSCFALQVKGFYLVLLVRYPGIPPLHNYLDLLRSGLQ
jgi:hypothetical protein